MNSDKTIRNDEDDIIRSNTPSDKTIREDSQVIQSGIENTDKTVRITDSTINTGVSENNDATIRTAEEDHIIHSDHETSKQPVIKSLSETEKDTIVLGDDKYKIVKTISESTGEAQIYLAHKNNEEFVLKLYYPNIKPKENLLKKLRTLQHENIIRVFSYGYYNDPASRSQRFYEVMEYAQGGTVDECLPIKDPKKLKEIAFSAAKALDYCHKNGIIHRDIKPGNLFFKDKAKKNLLIGDFGISSLLDEEEMMHMTNQARTAIYASPELYQSIGGKTVITKEVDYYALGISILFMWLGKNPFEGYVELALMRIKCDGKVPIPEDLPADIAKVIKGLIVTDKEKRWGLQEIQKWYNGEEVEIFEQLITTDFKPFYFDTASNLVANDPKELAILMQKYPDIGTRYLYRGKISKWFEEGKDMLGSTAIEEIYETVYPQNQEAGLLAAIYYMNPDLPFNTPDGTICSSKKDFADLFENNFDTYKKELKKKDHPFYIYLNGHGEKKMVDYMLNFYKKGPDDIALLKIIYTLDKERPFRFEHPADEEGYDITFASDTKELENIINTYFKEGVEYLYNNYIPTWIEFCIDKYLAQKINKLINKFKDEDQEAGMMGVRYLLDEKFPYLGLNDDAVELQELPEIGEYILKHKDDYKQLLTYEYDYLYLFLESRGFTDQLEFTQYCVDYSQHVDKIGYYNEDMAMLKIARGFGTVVPYTFKDGTKITSLEELKTNLPKVQQEVKELVKNPQSLFCLWLALFFHENPFESFNEDGAYEHSLKAYLDYIKSINASTFPPVKRYDKAQSKIKTVFSLNKTADNIYTIIKALVVVLTIVLGGIAIYQLFVDGVRLEDNPLPGAFWKIDFTYYLVMMILTTLFIFFTSIMDGEFSFSTTFFGGPIVGLGVAVVLYYIAYFIISLLHPYVYYIAIGMGILGLAGSLYGIFINPYASKLLKKELYGNVKNSILEYGPLSFAFSEAKNYVLAHNTTINDYAKNRRKNLWKIIFIGVFSILILGGTAFSFLFFHPHYKDQDFILFKNQSVLYQLKAENRKIKEAITGRWEGTFDGTRAVMRMTANDTLGIDGSLSVYYNTYVNQSFIGYYNKETQQILLNDTINKKFKGSYKFTYSPDTTVSSKKYEKYNAEGTWKGKSLKTVKFTFSKTTKK